LQQDLQAPGVGIKSAWFAGTRATNTIRGTSMAAPPALSLDAFFRRFDGRPSGGTSSTTVYRWTFGDGKSGQGESISHRFPARRSYVVRLTLRDPGRASNATSKTITCNGQRCT